MTLGRLAKGLPRYYMDCGWYRHPKFAGLPVESLFTFEAIVGYATEHATDGRAPSDLEDLSAALGLRISTVRKGLPALVERGAVVEIGGVLEVVGYGAHNPSAVDIEAHQQERSESGQRGNHKRWHEGRGVSDPNCRFCESGSDRSSDPPVIANGSHSMGWDSMGSDRSTDLGAAIEAIPPEPVAPTGRKRDMLFEAVCDACGIDFGNLTTSSRGPLNKAVGELRAIGVTPSEVPGRAATYHRVYPDTALTPTALAKHWPQLDPAVASMPQRANGVAGRTQAALERLRSQ